MSDVDLFESRLEARLRAHAELAVRVRDAGAIAQAAIAGSGREPRAGVGGWFGQLPRPVALVLLLALVAMLAAAAVVGARLLLTAPPPFEGQGRGTFGEAGRLTFPREDHTAVLLADGRVLVVGGRTDASGLVERLAPLPSELWDPRTGAFTLVDPILAPFDQAEGDGGTTATLLDDGRVLVAGGISGFQGSTDKTNRAALFDPATLTVTQTGPMTVPRARHVAVRLTDGRVLIAGGDFRSAEIYDPDTGTFGPTGTMEVGRSQIAPDEAFGIGATVLTSGRVLVFGGGEPPDEIFDPATGTFASVRVVGRLEDVPSIVLLDGEAVYRYDLITGTATYITPQPAELVREFGPRCRDLPFDCVTGMSSTGMSDGRILLAGGSRYLVDQRLYHGEPRVTGELFDPVSGRVVPTGPIVQPRTGHTATLLPDGRVLLVGGRAAEPLPNNGAEEDPPPNLLSSAEIFTP